MAIEIMDLPSKSGAFLWLPGALSPVTWTLLASGARWSSAARLLAAAGQWRQADAALHRAVMSRWDLALPAVSTVNVNQLQFISQSSNLSIYLSIN